MTSIFGASVHFVNQPLVKEVIKNFAGSITFVFGLVEIYELYQIIRGREITDEDCSAYPRWIQITIKVMVISSKISIILSAGVTHPGIFIISSLVGCFFSTAQLDSVFGPNTLFVINPWHPRHIISIIAVILALPSVMRSVYQGIQWIFKTLSKQSASQYKIQVAVLFTTLMSRPVLHLVNQLGRFVLKPL